MATSKSRAARLRARLNDQQNDTNDDAPSAGEVRRATSATPSAAPSSASLATGPLTPDAHERHHVNSKQQHEVDERSNSRQADDENKVGPARTAGRILLGSALMFAGLSHLTFARKDFQAQVPRSLDLPLDDTVLVSGGVEMALGAAILAKGGRRPFMGRFTALFFTAIFPGNLGQFVGRRDAFGLDSDNKRLVRLLGQPVLIVWALWCMKAGPRKRK